MKYLVVLTTLAALTFFSCGENKSEGNAEGENNKPMTAESKLANGETLYKHHCSLCHGPDGTLGASGAKNLKESKLTEQDDINVITYGVPSTAMIGFNDQLNAQDIECIAAWVQTLKQK